MRTCIQCSGELPPISPFHRKYCSGACKAKYRKTHVAGKLSDGHDCRVCGEHIALKAGQANKWICSARCRRAQNARSVREFHLRRPLMEAIYRARTREKVLPDNSNVRFYRLNPGAPRACQSCGEARVTEVAHKPGHERLGQRRTAANWKWPEMTWVLCPTCHRLLDRMNYSPEELGLTI
jgi:hypothetical protein